MREPSEEAIDELALELDDAVCEALGTPDHVLHNDGAAVPHVDVFIYAPGRIASGWFLVTVGRSTEPVAGRHVELMMHLRPDHELDDVEESAEVLRRVALSFGQTDPRWTFTPSEREPFASLGASLRWPTEYLETVFRRG